jgi:hypothetical protein
LNAIFKDQKVNGRILPWVHDRLSDRLLTQQDEKADTGIVSNPFSKTLPGPGKK